jgi:hypothetical protein
MRVFLAGCLGLLTIGTCQAQGKRDSIALQSKQAWLLAGGTKPVECYFWATKTEVSTVACLPLKHPTDDLPIILPANATDLYHTHPNGFPQLSEADRASQRKSGVRIHVIN